MYLNVGVITENFITKKVSIHFYLF